MTRNRVRALVSMLLVLAGILGAAALAGQQAFAQARNQTVDRTPASSSNSSKAPAR